MAIMARMAGRASAASCVRAEPVGCSGKAGTHRRFASQAMAARTATAKNGRRQPKLLPIRLPSGTPITMARLSPANMAAIARLACPCGASRAATVAPMAKKLPCATAVTTRPNSSMA